jgi:hypothetical protein
VEIAPYRDSSTRASRVGRRRTSEGDALVPCRSQLSPPPVESRCIALATRSPRPEQTQSGSGLKDYQPRLSDSVSLQSNLANSLRSRSERPCAESRFRTPRTWCLTQIAPVAAGINGRRHKIHRVVDSTQLVVRAVQVADEADHGENCDSHGGKTNYRMPRITRAAGVSRTLGTANAHIVG